MKVAQQKQADYDEARRQIKRRASSFVGNIEHSTSARFGMALKNRRKEIGMTQLDLAKITGLNRSYISQLERGKESISIDRAEKLAIAVGYSLLELLR